MKYIYILKREDKINMDLVYRAHFDHVELIKKEIKENKIEENKIKENKGDKIKVKYGPGDACIIL